MRRIFGTSHKAVIGILVFLFGAVPVSAGTFSDAQKAEIEKIVGEFIAENPEFIADYLRQNPEILLEVSDILRAKQAALQQEVGALALNAHREQIERHPMTPVTGNADGDVTLVEFFDYNCGYCKRVFAYMKDIERDDPNLRIVWKEFPILGPVSRFAAQAAMAADRQGKYIEFHRAMMSGGRLVSEDQVLKIAAKTGLDVERLKRDMQDPAISAYIDETLQLANTLGITGTPGFVVGDEIIAGAISEDEMKRVIEFTRQNGS